MQDYSQRQKTNRSGIESIQGSKNMAFHLHLQNDGKRCQTRLVQHKGRRKRGGQQ